ncbi:6274485c-86b0-4d9b-b18e-3ea1b8ff45e3-CDS [Sclerotinia trifoliorum]|uniref:6274485c-86b0-4d9b-b18e-3ea1b8ff45e3-CDS n=1 Tax=Sclerotinia trifoliorum TaxID=28548 RepID=A0A8H2VWP8_9HELO|nr:6274485c-86b0-4d9b-b18e-3ea1b8ff45e3-CDS [Sclerotinia trifoliorum]
MARYIDLPVDWATHNEIDVSALEQCVHRRDEAPEGCTCELCNSEEDHLNGWGRLENRAHTDISARQAKGWLDMSAPLPGPVINKELHTKTNKILSLTIDYSGDKQTDMSMVLRQLPNHCSWTGILELIIHPGRSRKEAPKLYANHVEEIKALVRQINSSLSKVESIRCHFFIDYFSFSHLRLAAGLIDLENDNWTLAYVEAGEKNRIKDIYRRDSVFKRIECVYREDFAE